MLSVRQLAQYILHNKVYGCETTFVLLKRQYIHAGIRTRSLPLRWCQLKCSVIIVMAPRRVPVSVPYTLNKDERFQTWLVGQAGMTLQLFSFFHPPLGVTQPVPLIKYGRFPPRSLRFQQVRLDTYCKLWCMGTYSTCICEVPSLYFNKSPSEKSSDTAFQNYVFSFHIPTC